MIKPKSIARVQHECRACPLQIVIGLRGDPPISACHHPVESPTRVTDEQIGRRWPLAFASRRMSVLYGSLADKLVHREGEVGKKMSQDSGNAPRTTGTQHQLEEKSLLGSSYSYQQGEMKVEDVDPSDDD